MIVDKILSEEVPLFELTPHHQNPLQINVIRYIPAPEETDYNYIEYVKDEDIEAAFTIDRTPDIEMNEVNTFNIGNNRKRHYPEETYGFKVPQTNLTTVYFEFEEETYSMLEYKPIEFYNLKMKQRQQTHQHLQIFEQLDLQPDWPNLPNKRLIPTLTYQLTNIQFQIMHNRLYIGDQRKYLPNVPNGVELCPRCTTTNGILYLFLHCPIVAEACRLLQMGWEILLRTLKDEIALITREPATYLDGYENILPHQQLFGISTFKIETYYK